MDFTRNADKIEDTGGRLSFNQCIDIDNSAAVPAELFSVGQFKQQYARIDNDYEDTLIEALIIAARRMCEQYVGMNFKPRTVVATINNLNGGTYLPYGPVGAVASIVDLEGNTITDYQLGGSLFKQLIRPEYEYLVVTYTGGWVSCPEELVTAVKEQTLWLYDNRGKEGVGMAPNAQMILKPLMRPR